jgi:hypothetical protein
MSSSINVESFRYNETGNCLSVTYKSGSTWEYYPISPETYKKLIDSNHIALSVHTALRAGTIVGRRINAHF